MGGFLLGLCNLGTVLVDRGEITSGELSSFFYHSMFLGLGLYGLVGLVPEVSVARAATRRLAKVVEESGFSSAALEVSTEDPVSLSFQDVYFGHDQTSKNVLAGFTLNVPAGTTCALVGSSGCGKSTALALLLRDATPQRGQILLGSEDINQSSREHIRTKLSGSRLRRGRVCSALSLCAQFR